MRVPYSPFFLDQVRAGHVEEISSKGTAIQGTFTQKQSYEGSKPTKRFRTEIPAFADTDALSACSRRTSVVVNAEPLDTGAPWWQSLLLGFGPTILFVVLLVLADAARRATCRTCSARSAARARAATSRRATA